MRSRRWAFFFTAAGLGWGLLAAAAPAAGQEADASPPPPEAAIAETTGPQEPSPERQTGEAAPGSEPVAETAESPAEADPFPVSEFLRPRVEFWKRVFAEWSEREFALHDSAHPQLVYEILRLPDSMETSSLAAHEYVRLRRRRIEERLRDLEAKVAAGGPLDDDDKALALVVSTSAGSEALRGAHARVRAQRGLKERFRRGIEASGRYLEHFGEIFRQAGLPEDLSYLPHVESSFDPRARSSARAIGLWQFTRTAGRRFLKVGPALDERWDPIASAYGAARYLARAYELLGSWPLAITSYNHGVGGMLRAKERFGTDFDRILREFDGRQFGFASKNFYAEFLAAREIARDPAAHFPEGVHLEPPLRHDRIVLDRAAAPHRIAQRYGVELSRLIPLNPAWSRRAVHRGLPLPAGTIVWLPEGTLRKGESGADAASTAAREAAESETGAVAATIADTIVHIVRRGESLFRIAARYGVSVAEILSHNQLSNPSLLKPGQRLVIPARP